MSCRAPDRVAIGRPTQTGAIAAMPPGRSGGATMPRQRNVIIDLENLAQLSRAELRTLWTEVLAEKPPPSLGRDILALGIAYARQERRYGGLTKSVAKEFDRLA